MEIAILMSTYNGEKYLNEQLKSLFNQDIDDHMTIYIRDDGSKDYTFEIIEKWKSKLNIVLYKMKNIGPAKSFWYLFMNPEIQADYYAFCDQDDIWDSDKLRVGVEALSKCNEKPALWCSNCRIIDQNGTVISEKMNIRMPNFNIISQLICGTTQGCAMLFNNELRRYIFEKNVSIVPMHDFVILTYSIVIGKIIYDEHPYFSYRVHSNNVVANNGKKGVKRIKSSLKRWFASENRNELSKFANVLLNDNKNFIDNDTQIYIKNLVRSKNNIVIRLRLVMDKKTSSNNKKAERSFKIRTILCLI